MTLAPLSVAAQTHNTLNFGHMDQQAPSNAEPATVTPELLADMMVVHGHYADAIEAYQKLRPQTAAIYNKIGIAYQRMAKDDEAIESYGQATRLDRKFAAPYNNLGTVYFHENENMRAQQVDHAGRGEPRRSGATLARCTWPNANTATAPRPTRRRFSAGPRYLPGYRSERDSQNATPAELAKLYLTFAEIYAHAGMKTQAILYLHKAIDEGLRDRQAAGAGISSSPHRTENPEFEALVKDQQK